MFCQPGFEYFQRELPGSTHNYLEIGVFNGDSIAALARNNPNLTIYGVDPFLEDGYTQHTTHVNRHEFMPEQQRNTHNNIKGLSNVTLFEKTSEAFAGTITDELVAIMDVAWVLIDGSHHYRDVIIDVDLALRLIGSRPGGIVFDDLNLDDVDRARRYFVAQAGDRVGPAEDLSSQHPGHIMAYSINR
jgi:hypothetical protein